MKITFEEFIKRIAETYREDAERLDCKTLNEVFSNYDYSSDDLREEVRYSLCREREELFPELKYFENFELFDDCSILLYGEEISYRKIVSALRKYKF